jgi:SAM-dependent methyltransferase
LEGHFEKEPGVLVIGDGLGLDSAYLSQAGNKITYFEVPGYSESFARKVFAECSDEITVLTNWKLIPLRVYDAVICLDVLEHLPNPPATVKEIAGFLRPGGLFIVHAPFYMVHPSNPTHLKANRRYSGSLSLYAKNNLQLVDGKWTWNPIVFQDKRSLSVRSSWLPPRLLTLRMAGLYLTLGRFSIVPFLWINSLRRRKNRWLCE